MEDIEYMQKILRSFHLHTVCEEAFCPNISECFTSKTATFLIMGRYCTRNCRFCNVVHHKPETINPKESDMIAQATQNLNLKYVVITSVTRDDLPDFGSSCFVNVVEKLKPLNVKIELLIPDFQCKTEYLQLVANSGAQVIGHNIETVKRLYPKARPQADYSSSLNVLKKLKQLNPNLITKSGIMLGFGETQDEVIETINDIVQTGCDILTIGQYLRPSKEHLPVVKFIDPSDFEYYKSIGIKIGFKYVESSVFTRSSYNAENAYDHLESKKT
ncbi:lipoyl synthase [Desulfurella amilsii]|nr:lipoyl synthase [Desulfurella amilsii]